ncbi:MAG: OsmC family protein [Solirubrobacteraceae bacterium]
MSIRDHQLLVDEARSAGGDDEGPSPEELLAASLASCTAITMEMYAQRKGWDVGPVEVDVQYSPAERGCPTKFELVLHLPAELADEQVDQLRVIAAKCPIHRTLDGEVMFSERVERVNLTR